MIINGRVITTLVMLGLFLAGCLIALGLPAKAAFMPLLVGIPGALLCFAQLVIDLRQNKSDRAVASAKPKSDDKSVDGSSEAQMFLWLALFTVVLIGFGFILGGPVIVALYIRYSSRDSWMNAIFAASCTFAVLYGVFIWLLELSLFQGLIVEFLMP